MRWIRKIQKNKKEGKNGGKEKKRLFCFFRKHTWRFPVLVCFPPVGNALMLPPSCDPPSVEPTCMGSFPYKIASQKENTEIHSKTRRTVFHLFNKTKFSQHLLPFGFTRCLLYKEEDFSGETSQARRVFSSSSSSSYKKPSTHLSSSVFLHPLE